ncbi:RNA polymerase sigma factor [Puia dinghuensis]|uniref:DNA-directed RNA polymerase sigma-70 factor n=1 Tax=Puia dinghuensis TaxID=1792502 RepID=A0A8J2UHI3_9BACT|nr:RNA polymerase sigma-70 factor [Puia dinghuensis]GGB18468.1 DNA-directed RNA polymerase sigma-70 factor [Puia dinghuensis]
MSATPFHIDKALLRLISKGDTSAFNRFYHQTNAMIYKAAMAYVKDPQIAEEIVQVVYIKIWEYRERLIQVQDPDDYLYILARNTVFDYFRKVAAEHKHLAALRQQSPEHSDLVTASLQEKEGRQLLRQVVARLPSQQQQVYLLSSEEQMSYDEIAAAMHISRFTVKRHLELARRFVRKCLHHLGGLF